MRIALLVPEMPPDSIGGGGVVFEALATRLARDGHELSVIAAHTFGGPRETAPPSNYELVRVPEFPHPSSAFRTSMPPVLSPSFVRAVSLLRRADVVNAHGYGCPLIDVLGLFVPGDRIVYTLHGFLYRIPQGGGPLATIYKGYDAVLGSRVLHKASIVTAVSSYTVAEAAEHGRRDVRVLPNGCTPATPVPLSPSVAAEVGKAPYLLGIGRLQHFKGYEVAIDALDRLRNAGRNLRLMIAGTDAGAGDELRDQAARLGLAEHVSFLGQVPPGEVATLLQNAQAFVLTSHSESFSIATLEALNAGAPCVLSRLGGPLDIATDNVTALFFEDNDAGEMASCVERLLDDSGLRARLVQAGHQRARDFDWDQIVKRYEAAYEEVLSARTRH